MTAQEAYTEDLRRRPTFDDGSDRPTWENLGKGYSPTVAAAIRHSWEQNPTPRTWPVPDEDGQDPPPIKMEDLWEAALRTHEAVAGGRVTCSRIQARIAMRFARELGLLGFLHLDEESDMERARR